MAMGTHLGFPVHEEGVEAPKDSRAGHRPNQYLHGQRHDRRDLIGKNNGEQRRQDPHGRLEVPPLPRVGLRLLEHAQADEEQHEVDVGEGHEGHGGEVAVRAVDRHT